MTTEIDGADLNGGGREADERKAKIARPAFFARLDNGKRAAGPYITAGGLLSLFWAQSNLPPKIAPGSHLAAANSNPEGYGDVNQWLGGDAFVNS